MRREKLLLEDIIAAADAIAAFTQGQAMGSFEKNLMLRSATRQSRGRTSRLFATSSSTTTSASTGKKSGALPR
jgi:hypothetical protein